MKEIEFIDLIYKDEKLKKRIEETYAFEPNFNKAVENLLKI